MLDGKNILVVEDDSDIRELISFNLKNEGHQVFEAKDGEAGIDKARKKLPDPKQYVQKDVNKIRDLIKRNIISDLIQP